MVSPPTFAARLAWRCRTPRRTTLVAIVAGILWPILLVAYLAGLMWHAILVVGGGVKEWSDVAFDDDRL